MALRARQPGDVLVGTVGPFAKWATRRSGGDRRTRVYLELDRRAACIRRIAEELGPPAARAGATLMPAMGFDYVPGALAERSRLAEAGAETERVDVGYFSLSATGRA